MNVRRFARAVIVYAICFFPTGVLTQSRWSEVQLPFLTTPLTGISFVDRTHGCVYDGAHGFVFYTADNGATWQADTVPAPQGLRKCTIVADSTLWAWGYKSSATGAAAVFHSTDAGQTWMRADPPDSLEARDMVFVSDTMIWLAGRSHLWVSTDQGSSWHRRGAWTREAGFSFQSMECLDDSVGYISGSSLGFGPQRTTDGGWTWKDFWIWPPKGGYGDWCGPDIFAGDGLSSFAYYYSDEASTERFFGAILSWNGFKDTLHLRLDPYNRSTWARAISKNELWLKDKGWDHVLRRTTDGGRTWVVDTFNVYPEKALFDLRGHRLVLGEGRMFQLDRDPSTFGISSFPMAIGDQWRYRISYPNAQGPPAVTHTTIRIIGDTVMPGGKRFWVLDNADPLGGRYIRSDSGVVSYWRTAEPAGERQIADLRAEVGMRDSVQWDGYFTSVAGETYRAMVLGRSTVARHFSLDGIVVGHVTYADGFGYSGYTFFGDGSVPICIWDLTDCRIGGITYGAIDDVSPQSDLPKALMLQQNYPNPFNPQTTISFSIGVREHVTVTIYDLLGRAVATILNEEVQPGTHTVVWDASGVTSGAYFSVARTPSEVRCSKMLFVR